MKSLATRIAIKFSLVIAVLVILIAIFVVAVLRHSVRARQQAELEVASKSLGAFYTQENHDGTLDDIPYYLTYIVYEQKNQQNIATNDPFLPVLPITDSKAMVWVEKDFFTDGDLNLLYRTEVFETARNDRMVVQAALNLDNDTSEEFIAFLPRTLALIFIPLLILSYGAAFLIARRTLAPVKKITETAQKISSSNLESKLPVSKNGDELDQLAKTFNALFMRLKADFDRERSFTGNVSHELKTPVAVILGHANLIHRWGKDDPAQLEKSIGAIIDEAHSMESVISNLLELSRLESGKIKPKKENFSITALLKRIKEETLSYAPAAEFDISSVSADYEIISDSELLHQVFTIIVSNSVKFAANEDIKISVRAENDGGLTRLIFQDNGTGISEDVLPHIFERFYRGDKAHSRSAGGSGLGLAIAKEIMTVLGGGINAKNLEPPQHGAVFMVELKA